VSKKWSLGTAAQWGAVFGPAPVMVKVIASDELWPERPVEMIGYLIGSVIGGALVFILVAAVRNVFARHRRRSE
jgi:hypothetical protein